MQQFTGLEYIKIDVANNFGKDKLSWEDRILWFDLHIDELPYLVDEADNKFLAIKGLHAYHDAKAGKPTGFIMGLDATASGLQIMACLSGCKKTAEAVNLINTGKREDVYTTVANQMNALLPECEHVTRALVKKPIMTHYYNKSRPDGLSELQEAAFMQVLKDAFSGAEDVMQLINSCWDSTKLSNTWTLPDGHVAHVKVEEISKVRFDIDEIDTQITYQFTDNKPSTRSTSLCPNFIHSIDGWVAREMVRKANNQGFQLAHIHDSFWASPNHMNKVRKNYKSILANLSNSNIMQDFMSEITKKNVVLQKDSYDLDKLILDSEYALS